MCGTFRSNTHLYIYLIVSLFNSHCGIDYLAQILKRYLYQIFVHFPLKSITK